LHFEENNLWCCFQCFALVYTQETDRKKKRHDDVQRLLDGALGLEAVRDDHVMGVAVSQLGRAYICMRVCVLIWSCAMILDRVVPGLEGVSWGKKVSGRDCRFGEVPSLF
jgi:hypothetical protein